jgi:hypothetical protein
VVLLGGCDRAGVSVDIAKTKKPIPFFLAHLHINWGTVVDTSGLCVIYLGACLAVEVGEWVWVIQWTTPEKKHQRFFPPFFSG